MTRPCGPPFDLRVQPGGYAWWYLDALSDEGDHGISLIAFIGSVFSPYYARSRRKAAGAAADPLNHCALNVALYRHRAAGRWAMTERGREQVSRDSHSFRIGPSGLRWAGDTLTVDIDEWSVPWPSRLRGTVRLHAPCRFDHSVQLAPGHRWSPIAPRARAQVEIGSLRWTGDAYLDSNQGDEPMERAFRRWDWSRAGLAGGDSAVFYDVDRVQHEPLQLGLRFGASGRIDTIEEPPPASTLPTTLWRIERHARSDVGSTPTVLQTLTDAPFYARSLLAARWLGEPVMAMHESLSLMRFDSAWVQALLPFRMPRHAGRMQNSPAHPGPSTGNRA